MNRYFGIGNMEQLGELMLAVVALSVPVLTFVYLVL